MRIAAPDEAARWICSRDPRLNLCHRDDFSLRVRVGIVPALDARFCFPELREPSGGRARRLASASLQVWGSSYSRHVAACGSGNGSLTRVQAGKAHEKWDSPTKDPVHLKAH